MEGLNLDIDTKTLEQCLKEISHIGGTTYQNICTGENVFVPWGTLDWIVVLGLGLLGLVSLGIFIKTIVSSSL
jgi:hypothetical protein